MIPVTQKASNVCTYCRLRKQRCDRALPSCSRCSGKLRMCDYTWLKDAPPLLGSNATPLVLLFVQSGMCSSDLSARGRDELLNAVTTWTRRESDPTNKLSELVWEILDLAETSISGMMEEHATSVHQWCPLIDEELLQGGRNGAYDNVPPDSLPNPLLLLCILLLTRHNFEHPERVSMSVLYTTVKQLLALAHAAGVTSLELFRAQMLLATYECGHRLIKQAYVTLSSSVAMFELIQLELCKPNRGGPDEGTIASLKAAIIMLDRMIPLSAVSILLPLTTPSKCDLSRSIASTLDPTVPPHSPTGYASSPRKVHIRAMVALASGRALEYAHSSNYGVDPHETYDQVDAAVSLVIKKLVDKPQPHTWLHCDAIAMAFCSHLLLQQAQIRHLRTASIDPSHSEAAKAMLALHYSRRMAWDMVRVAIQKIPSEEALPLLPFAGLCCVLRAAVAVFETREFEDDFRISDDEVNGLMRILKWFAARWTIGVEYVKHVEKLLGC